MPKSIKTVLLFVLLIFSPFGDVFSMTAEEKRDFVYIDFFNFVQYYNTFDRKIVSTKFFNKTVDLNNTFFTNFILPADKYVTTLQYRGAARQVNFLERVFLLDWFKIDNDYLSYRQNNSAQTIIADDNFDLFYKSVMYSAKGRSYFITTQSAISEKMEKELKIGDSIEVYMLNLGQVSNEIPTFLVLGYEKMDNSERLRREENANLEDLFASIRRDFENRSFDRAKGRLEQILKTNPNNIQAKLNVCMVYVRTNFFSSSISCYNDVLKVEPNNYVALYGLGMAYHLDTTMNTKTRATNTIKYTTKSIEEINKITNTPTGSLAILYYDAYFLRGLAKVNVGDKTAVEDFFIVYNNEPTLLSSSSLDYYKQLLGVK